MSRISKRDLQLRYEYPMELDIDFYSKYPLDLQFKVKTDIKDMPQQFQQDMLNNIKKAHKDRLITEITATLNKSRKYKEGSHTHQIDLDRLSLHYITKIGKSIKGEYYAHEYDIYTSGRIRKVEFNDGSTDYFVECLDNTLIVLDGYWSAEDIGGSRIGNGCGDYFVPFSKAW